MTAQPRILATLLACLCTTVFAGENGSLKGFVKADGELPSLAPIAVEPAKAAGCKCTEAPGLFSIDTKTLGIQWVVVRIMDVKAPEPAEPPKMPVIDQAGCVYSPRASVVPVGGTVDMLNPEGIMHSIVLTPYDDANNAPLSAAMLPTMPKMTLKKKHFAEPGVQLLSCAPHSWMKGLIVIHDPRFAAVTAADGSFEIKNVPPGKYKLMVNHEAFDETHEVEIKAGAETLLEVKRKFKK